MKAKKRAIYTLVAITAFLMLANLMGLVGFHYLEIVNNQPLKNPVKVVSFKNNAITLEDGRVLMLQIPLFAADLKASDGMIDVEGTPENGYTIYGAREIFVCGTPWAKLITIPIIADTVHKNKRQLVSMAELISE